VIHIAMELPRIPASSLSSATNRGTTMRGILLWAIGIPIPIIILLYLFHAI
jgi:hypothetical protein